MTERRQADGQAVNAEVLQLPQKITEDGQGDYSATVYKYRADKGGWTNGKTLQTGVTLKNGEAVCVNNTSGAAVEFRSSGEVDLSPVSAEIGEGFSLYGNMTPVTIDINDMKVYVGDTELQDNNVVVLQKMNEDGLGDYSATVYKYRADKGGWTNGKTLQTGVTLAPGEAFCINNTSGKTITLKFPSPLANGK